MRELPPLSKKFLFEFIDIYRKNQCLWNAKSPEYSNRVKKNLAYNELLKKLQVIEPDATEGTVKRKINSLRTAFRTQHRKVIEWKDAPTLCYYDSLKFLLEQQPPKPCASNGDVDDIEAECSKSIELSSLEGSDDDLDEFSTNAEEIIRANVTTGRLQPTGSGSDRSWTLEVPARKSTKRKSDEELVIVTSKLPKQEVIYLEDDNFDKPEFSIESSDGDLNALSVKEPKRTDGKKYSLPSKKSSRKPTTTKKPKVLQIVTGKMPKQDVTPLEFENFGKYIAEEMRKLSKEQAILLAKIISDDIFKVQCGIIKPQTNIEVGTDGGAEATDSIRPAT